MIRLGITPGGIITFFIGADAAFAGRILDRQIMQQRRIHQGIKSGELTRCEIKRVERAQNRIQRQKKRDWSDGQLTTRERLRLEHEQDRAGRHIYQLKHNDRKR